ncbi:hypothetical protein PanWU01x14_094560 [Parasponia andersonii]|uniref:Uncharacterized protein n=1 Tax=Parasponia andersonii TaxID=3476 RepID=A0A2P5D5U2_PARAD|nr:hypothetical protein PanWU01x14_094560 [Parasponia andersonii]
MALEDLLGHQHVKAMLASPTPSEIISSAIELPSYYSIRWVDVTVLCKWRCGAMALIPRHCGSMERHNSTTEVASKRHFLAL